jgi:hypothetical protein
MCLENYMISYDEMCCVVVLHSVSVYFNTTNSILHWFSYIITYYNSVYKVFDFIFSRSK